MAFSDRVINFVLLGHTGNGKSSTGNTILNQKCFKVCDGMSDDGTVGIQSDKTTIKSSTVNVWDSPGIDGSEQKKKIRKKLEKIWKQCSGGFNALVLVLRYGKRFTQEEKKTVDILKEIIAENFVRDHCILAFTYGENFKVKSDCPDFDTWCQKQTGDLGKLIDECGKRVVLFYNLSPDKREESIKELMKLCERVKSVPLDNEYFCNQIDTKASGKFCRTT